ncbi:hypothetical protein SY89_02374 [Halolamina pelagica]|jgi:hypothetical protein|uniref:Uncharacterized protein n=1 Tax=Halolamina pelagica TaxID=699431 RepID=A0A0P7GCE2_9EURY|nr:hypothetical protein [Halolamina pelagica]KPN31625.1 hypothetical protein SY89_02374 [Halolamina pelagica]
MYEQLKRLREFGTRSLVVHSLMAVTFVAAIASAFLLSGQLQLVSFVAFVNFTAGLWVSHSVHSLGNTFTEDEYEGVTGEL